MAKQTLVCDPNVSVEHFSGLGCVNICKPVNLWGMYSGHLRGDTPSKCSQHVLKMMPVCSFTFQVAVHTQWHSWCASSRPCPTANQWLLSCFSIPVCLSFHFWRPKWIRYKRWHQNHYNPQEGRRRKRGSIINIISIFQEMQFMQREMKRWGPGSHSSSVRGWT